MISFLGRKSGGGKGRGPLEGMAEVRAYWQALRDGPALPSRDRIDPRGIAGALEQVMLIERIAPGLARFRIAGMAINDLQGLEVRGMPLSVLFDAASRPRLAEGLEAVFATPCVLDIQMEAERGIGRPMLSARLMLLPVRGHRGEVDMALGCLALTGEAGRAPRRFAIARILQEPIEGHPAPQRPLAPEILLPGFAEPPARFAGPKAHPHLRLVKSDD